MLLSHFSDRFLERFSCKIMAAADNFFRFTVAILFVYIGSRTPDGTWNQGWSNGPKIKSPSVFAAICDDQIRRDRCRKSPGVSPALFGMKRNPKSAREISVTMEEKGILKVRETLT